MNNITKEQIIRMENIGLSIADSLSDEYSALVQSHNDNKENINRLYSEFGRIIKDMNKEDINHA